MSVVVLLYSKYSRGCEKLLETMSVMDFRKICVDHDEVRRLIRADQKKYNIKEVPCILVFFANGVMKKYEGTNAFEWVRDTVEKMRYISTSAPKEEQVQLNPQQAVPQHEVQMVSPSSVSSSVPAFRKKEGSGGVPSRAASQNGSKPLFTLKPEQQQPERTLSSSLSREAPIPVQQVDVEDDGVPDMRRAMDTSPLPIQKLSPKTNDEAQDLSSDSGNGATPMRGIKSDKQESIMSVAQQMQKQREREDEAQNPLQPGR